MLIIANASETWGKIELYIISLWLLFVFIIIIKIDIPFYLGPNSYFIGLKELTKRNVLPLISSLFLFSGIIFFSRFKYKLGGSKRTPFEITKLENLNHDHLAFLTTYIIPLITFNFDSLRYTIAFFLLLIIIGAIYVKTNMFYANPSLALLGFRIYKVDGTFRTGDRQDIILISTEKLALGMKVSYKKLDEKIYYVRVKNDKN
ncbi:anti-phage protein KwaA [Clostridium sp. BSD9I1]|uniref:anti-phage protein KwaA n=1 Tax=Clostridium sp. BSD9I1 TaxID=2003589 RepID=UPI001A9A3AFF|nr:anti-phage protein KwaA [Clostridium sp. BSD9I1]